MSFAYLLESFPDPSKTFVFREVAEAVRQGLEPLIVSIRRPTEAERSLYEGCTLPVLELPPEPELRAAVDADRAAFSSRQRRELSHWRSVKGDSNRVFEALWLGRELRRRGIRHVHAHFAGLAARTAWLLRELWGITYSFTGHADDIFSPEPRQISLAHLVQGARFVATETDYSRNRLEQEFPAARGKTFRVFNGIGEDCFEHRKKHTGVMVPPPGTPPLIVCVGRLVEKKGFPVLLSACAMLSEQGVPFRLEIIGGGPLEEAIRAQISQLNLAAVVTLSGVQPQSYVRARLAAARVFALAAQREGDGGSDNLPTVIMEAMATGIPVVSTRVAGIPEMVEEGKTGLLVAEGDVAALADALASYLHDAAKAVTHGEDGIRQARAKFCLEKNVAVLAELLAQRAHVRFPPAVLLARPQWKIPWWRRWSLN